MQQSGYIWEKGKTHGNLRQLEQMQYRGRIQTHTLALLVVSRGCTNWHWEPYQILPDSVLAWAYNRPWIQSRIGQQMPNEQQKKKKKKYVIMHTSWKSSLNLFLSSSAYFSKRTNRKLLKTPTGNSQVLRQLCESWWWYRARPRPYIHRLHEQGNEVLDFQQALGVVNFV